MLELAFFTWKYFQALILLPSSLSEQCIYGKPGGPLFTSAAYTAVLHHSQNPDFSDEVRTRRHSLCLRLMGEEGRETLSKLHLRLKTSSYSSQGSTVTLTEVTLTGDSPGVCYKFLQLSSGLSFKKKDSFILSFFSDETVLFSHLFCVWFW